MDSFWWLHATGRLARTIDEMPDPEVARHEPSVQLVGRNDPPAADLDLGTLQERGVRLVGRLLGAAGSTVHLDDNLADDVATSDRQLRRFLDTVDHHIACSGITREVWAPGRPRPIQVTEPPRRLDLRAEGIGTVLVAAGYRPDYPFLEVPVLAEDGRILQRQGVTPAPGLYVVGQRFQHRRDSATIDGARHDARSVVAHLLARSEEPALEGEEPAA
jgi:putative flavoprotein involved in K+ transport